MCVSICILITIPAIRGNYSKKSLGNRQEISNEFQRILKEYQSILMKFRWIIFLEQCFGVTSYLVVYPSDTSFSRDSLSARSFVYLVQQIFTHTFADSIPPLIHTQSNVFAYMNVCLHVWPYYRMPQTIFNHLRFVLPCMDKKM